MAWQTWNGEGAPESPTLTIQKRGPMTLNAAALQLLGDAQKVDLLFDAETRSIGIRPSDEGRVTLSASPLRRGCLSAAGFLAHFDIAISATTVYPLQHSEGDPPLVARIAEGRAKNPKPARILEPVKRTNGAAPVAVAAPDPRSRAGAPPISERMRAAGQEVRTLLAGQRRLTKQVEERLAFDHQLSDKQLNTVIIEAFEELPTPQRLAYAVDYVRGHVADGGRRTTGLEQLLMQRYSLTQAEACRAINEASKRSEVPA